ncbi:MAG: sialate O-acetylesterase [Chitinophagaceae bacterium]
MKKLIYFIIVSSCAVSSFSQIRLPAIIRDSMILQRNEKVNIWGWASAKEKIQVQFKGKSYKAVADTTGKWQVKLPPTAAGGPYTIELRARNTITIREILFGDVWFCSGQSNMVHQLNIHDVRYADEIAAANYPQIRQCWIPTLTALNGARENLPPVYWKSATGPDVRPFSAVAYFFAKKIFEQYHVPVGIINASVGGTPIEAWISEEGLKDFSAIKNSIEKNKDATYLDSLKRPAQSTGTRPAMPADLGLTGDIKWFDSAYTPKGWRNIYIPGYWEDQGVKDLNGVVWYRKVIDIPASMPGQAARAFIGRIVDADELYINGKKVGSTGYQYPQRRYAVPLGLLKAGKNLFVIRVTNTNGKGGFVPDKPYYLFAGNDTVPLNGDWQYKVGAVYKPVESGGYAPGISFQNQPAALYNAMVSPETNYTIKGFCWYQGESNEGNPQQYAVLQAALIHDWRTKWKNDSLPFLFVQLPGFMDYNYLPSESNWALLREAQMKALALPATAMAVAIDIGEWNDIHPDNKKSVGDRLALAAFKIGYHEPIIFSGPLYQSAAIDGDKIVVSFINTGTGLKTSDAEVPAEFAIAGADKKFVWANAKIVGDKIMVWNEMIATPKYVRYAWSDNPVNPNLINQEGLPAAPFRTDE